MLIKIVEIKYYKILWCTDNARFLLEVYFAQKKIFKKGFPAWLPYCIYYIYFILYIYIYNIYIYIYMYVCMYAYIHMFKCKVWMFFTTKWNMTNHTYTNFSKKTFIYFFFITIHIYLLICLLYFYEYYEYYGFSIFF